MQDMDDTHSLLQCHVLLEHHLARLTLSHAKLCKAITADTAPGCRDWATMGTDLGVLGWREFCPREASLAVLLPPSPSHLTRTTFLVVSGPDAAAVGV